MRSRSKWFRLVVAIIILALTSCVAVVILSRAESRTRFLRYRQWIAFEAIGAIEEFILRHGGTQVDVKAAEVVDELKCAPTPHGWPDEKTFLAYDMGWSVRRFSVDNLEGVAFFDTRNGSEVAHVTGSTLRSWQSLAKSDPEAAMLMADQIAKHRR